MIVYLHGSVDKLPVENHTLIICPAGHLPKEFESDSWWDRTGERAVPLQFQVVFHHGEAETTDEIGRYLVKTGQAMKNRLVLANSWNR